MSHKRQLIIVPLWNSHGARYRLARVLGRALCNKSGREFRARTLCPKTNSRGEADNGPINQQVGQALR